MMALRGSDKANNKETLVNKIMKLSLLCVAALACTALPAFAGQITTVPEPVSFLLLASGIGSVLLLRRGRK